MAKHSKGCECDQCFRKAVLNSVDKWIEETARENPGVVCPFCGTNPSEPAKYGSGFKDSCGHEVRVGGLVTGWKLKARGEMVKCTNSEKTGQLVYAKGIWVEQQ